MAKFSRWATCLLVLLAACQTPRQEGWLDTPTDSRVKGSPIVIVVVAWPFSVTVIRGVGHEVDQSGAIGGGKASGQQADQTTRVDADATVPLK